MRSRPTGGRRRTFRSEEHSSELQSHVNIVCRLLLEKKTTTVIGLFALFNTTYVLSAYPAGLVSDKIPRRFLFTAGLIVVALVYAGFAIINDARWLWGLFAVYGLYMGLTDGVSRAIVSDLVNTAHRGSALGLHAAVLGFAAFPASAAAGWL